MKKEQQIFVLCIMIIANAALLFLAAIILKQWFCGISGLISIIGLWVFMYKIKDGVEVNETPAGFYGFNKKPVNKSVNDDIKTDEPEVIFDFNIFGKWWDKFIEWLNK
jgi:hypothetical protein